MKGLADRSAQIFEKAMWATLVIEANIRELLHNPPEEQSWC
jgi:hypothetical protein